MTLKKLKTLFSISSIGLTFFVGQSFANSAYMVYDFTQNKVLESKNQNQSLPIASITKLMTANVFLEHNKNKNCSTKILPSDKDFLKNTTSRLPKNVEISCHELLKAMLVRSDNYAAHALAHATNLSKEQFINEMNKTAKRLGMKNTYFADSSGLSSENVSSVADLVKLTSYSLKKKELINISSLRSTEVYANGKTIPMTNTNKLIRENIWEGALSKTGYTKEAGYNLVFVPNASCNGSVVGVISLNNGSSQSRSNFTNQKLLKYNCL